MLGAGGSGLGARKRKRGRPLGHSPFSVTTGLRVPSPEPRNPAGEAGLLLRLVQDFLDRLLREDLIQAIEALPEPFRVAVVLADIQGCSYMEIAEALAVPVGTVRSRLARGRALLQKALWLHACDSGLRSPQAARRDEHS